MQEQIVGCGTGNSDSRNLRENALACREVSGYSLGASLMHDTQPFAELSLKRWRGGVSFQLIDIIFTGHVYRQPCPSVLASYSKFDPLFMNFFIYLNHCLMILCRNTKHMQMAYFSSKSLPRFGTVDDSRQHAVDFQTELSPCSPLVLDILLRIFPAPTFFFLIQISS